ncbi:hypothetical protein ABPG74_017271 [Tetrahymena malaccensis]
MSKSVLDRKNITLRKILSSIPYSKLSQIYDQKIQNFKETLIEQKQKMQKLSVPLKKQIKPTFNHHISTNPLLVSLLTAKYQQTDRSEGKISEKTEDKKTEDIIVEEQFQLIDLDDQQKEPQNSCRSLLVSKKQFESSPQSKQNINTKSVELISSANQQSLSEQNKNKFHKIDEKAIIKKQNSQNIQSYRSIRSNSKKLALMTFHSQRGTKNQNYFNQIQRNSSIESEKQYSDKDNNNSGQNNIIVIKQSSQNLQKSTSTKNSQNNAQENSQKALRVKSKNEVDTTILEKKQRRYTDLSNSAAFKTGGFSTFYSSKLSFQDGQKYFNVKDKLQFAFDEYLDNDEILTSPRSRQATVSSNNSNPRSLKRKVTISDQVSNTFRQNTSNQIEKLSIFDNNNYFKKRYDPTAGFSLKLSQSAHDLNLQFEKILQKQIQGIDILKTQNSQNA